MIPSSTWTSAIHRAVFIVTMMLASRSAQSQQEPPDEPAEGCFQRGLVAFDHAQYRAAQAAFDSVIAHPPGNKRESAAYIMKAKSVYALNEYYDASKIVRSFLTRYPTSRYVADANLLLARIYLRIERYDEAGQAAILAWRSMPQDPAASLAREVLWVVDNIFLDHASPEMLYNAIKWGVSPTERGHLWSLAVQREIARGNLSAATTALDTLSGRYSTWIPHETIEKLRAQLSGVSTMRIGVLLPLFENGPDSPVKQIGNSAYDGILTAFRHFVTNEGRSVQISLDARDSQHDLQIATEQARSLVKDSSVIAIIGPIYSNDAVAAARVAGANGVPLITPTANQNGISALGPTIFQANPDYEQRGRAMARYAVQVLGSHTVGVLAPSDTYAKFLAEGFVKEAKEEGANVAVIQSYQKGMSDLRAQFTAIRAAGMQQTAEPMVMFGGKMSRPDVMNLVRLGLPLKRVDSLLAHGAKVSARWLLGPRGKELLDSVGVHIWYDQSALDSLEHSVTGIEALYCPISGPEEIGIISSQIVYNNIKTHVLGSGEWNSVPDLEANQRYSKGIQFESDTYVDTSSAAFKQFSTEFVKQFKKAPDRFTIYGYDAASLVLSQIARGGTSRIALTRLLAGAKAFQGVRGKIGFNAGRVNSWIHIMEYTGDGLVHVTEVYGSPLLEEGKK